MKALSLVVVSLHCATLVLGANTCTSNLHKEVIDNDQDHWWATATCTELDQGCAFRAVLDIAGAIDVRSGFTNELNKEMKTDKAGKI